MKTSEFQFANPYLTDLYFKINPMFNKKQEISMENAFSIQVKKVKNKNIPFINFSEEFESPQKSL